MPNKHYPQLNPLDRELRLSAPVVMEDGVKEIILRFAGFELFNTRAYHNYETWSDGYTIIARRDGAAMSRDEVNEVLWKHTDRETYVFAVEEDLDDAIRKVAEERAKAKAHAS